MHLLSVTRNHLFTLTLMLAALYSSAVFADDFPNVKGTWSGSYKVAFPQGHPQYPNQAVATTMELEVYRQEGNLLWVINRWRRNNEGPWVIEYGTGTFDLDDTDTMYIVERGPAPEQGVNTGSFVGSFDDGAIYLNYAGPGDAISFAVKLERKSR